MLCPRCRQKGSLHQKVIRGRAYYYVAHYKSKKGSTTRIRWCYVDPLVKGVIQGLKALPKKAEGLVPRGTISATKDIPAALKTIDRIDVREDQELQEVRCKDCALLDENRVCLFSGAELSEEATNQPWECEVFQPKEKL